MALLRKYCDGGVNYHNPDLKGKIIIVTGANSGMGEASVQHLSTLGPHKIILACRNKFKALETIKKVKDCPPDMLEFYPLDLNDLNSVKNFANYFNEKYYRLDILLNNAGIMALQERQFTKQGLEK